MILYQDIIFKGYTHRDKGQGVRTLNGKTFEYSYGECIKINGEYVDEDEKVRPIILKTNSNSYEKIKEFVKTLKAYDKINCEINFVPYNEKCTFYINSAKKV